MRFAVALLLIVWPFHHRPQVVAPASYDPMVWPSPDGNTYRCTRNDSGMYIFVGNDGTAGADALNGEGAIKSWLRIIPKSPRKGAA